MFQPITERQQHILGLLVRSYVEDGSPIGSKTLVERFGLDVSPATVRNEMAALEDMGYDTVFLISFGLVIVAGLAALAVMQGDSVADEEVARVFTFKDMRLVLKKPALLFLLGGVTIPMNVLMAAFLWYLVPLTMSSAGSDASAIARTLMIYYLVILLGSGAGLPQLAQRSRIPPPRPASFITSTSASGTRRLEGHRLRSPWTSPMRSCPREVAARPWLRCARSSGSAALPAS